MAGIFRPLKKNLTNPMFDPASASGPENTMPASLVQAAQAAPSVPLVDPQKAAQIQRLRPSAPDMSRSVTTPGVIEANNAANGVIDTSGGIGLRQIADAGKVAVNGAVGAFRRGTAIVADPGAQFAKERAQDSAVQLNPESVIVPAPAAVSLRPATAPAPVVQPSPAPVAAAGGDAMLPGAIQPGSAAGLRPGEARFFDPRTATTRQVNTNMPGWDADPRTVQGPAAYDQGAGIDAAKADPARQVAFRPGERDGYRTSDRGPYFNLRPRKTTELAQEQGRSAAEVARIQGGAAVDVETQRTSTAREVAMATEAEKTRRANEELQGKKIEAQGRVDAAKAGKADVTPGVAKQSDAALKSIDAEISDRVEGKTTIKGLATRAAEAQKKADGFWGNESDKKAAADLNDQLSKANARRQALIDGMTGTPAAPAPEATPSAGSPNQAHIDLLLKNPAMAKDFDAKFGTGAAAKYLTKKG